MNFLRLPEDVPIENKTVSRAIQSAQTQVEQQNYEIRKDVLKYDDVLNKQRTVVYDERREVLDGADLSEQLRRMVEEVVSGYVEGATSNGYAEEWDLDQLWTALGQLYPVALSQEEAVEQAGGEPNDLTRAFLVEELVADAAAAYDAREEDLTPEVMRELERRVLLSVLDRKWREHLYEMDYLREGIGLRAMAQRDPLVEYQREGFDMFSTMMEGIKEESVGFLFNLEVQVDAAPAASAAVPVAAAPKTADPERVLRDLAEVEEHQDDDALAAEEGEGFAEAKEPESGKRPTISAKGLERDTSAKPMVYSSPTLDSDEAEVRIGNSDGSGDDPKASASGAKRQAQRSNPNRGSRGNRSGSRGNRSRKR
jgi:preprotein translocase subunit SecA